MINNYLLSNCSEQALWNFVQNLSSYFANSQTTAELSLKFKLNQLPESCNKL